MIRVLQVINNMDVGGMETMLMNYYRNIDRKKIQFDFLIFNKKPCLHEDEIKKLGGKIYKLTSRRKNFIKNKIEVKKFFKTHKYDIVEFHQGITYYYPLKMSKKYEVKNRIIHNHGIDQKLLKRLRLYNNLFAKRRISNLANYYFTCSKEIENNLFSDRVIKNKEIILINNAIDLEKFKYSNENRNKIREEFNINDDSILIGHVGKFDYQKNHLFLLQIFYEISKLDANIKFMLVGKGVLENQIREKIKEFKLDDKVIITKDRKDVNKIMSALDYFVFPSLFEGLPLVLIEAQASGVPIFMSDTINKNAKQIDNGEIISLNLEPKEWASIILNYKSSIRRNDAFNLMKETDFNINKGAKKLENIYLNMTTNNYKK